MTQQGISSAYLGRPQESSGNKKVNLCQLVFVLAVFYDGRFSFLDILLELKGLILHGSFDIYCCPFFGRHILECHLGQDTQVTSFFNQITFILRFVRKVCCFLSDTQKCLLQTKFYIHYLACTAYSWRRTFTSKLFLFYHLLII